MNTQTTRRKGLMENSLSPNSNYACETQYCADTFAHQLRKREGPSGVENEIVGYGRQGKRVRCQCTEGKKVSLQPQETFTTF